ncbi:hypothetical protein [Streptomyces sp. SID3343]|uniref:hypothetical protein n=1 Tax=Streptomyces sp. SID3343 TaxID=2690260 RepID=UPI00136C5417|nr:hypothetical protein [Streptomyces sp. SID3343]MYW04463.1 hypothetical protein [Streptomyces sp. SID3343]
MNDRTAANSPKFPAPSYLVSAVPSPDPARPIRLRIDHGLPGARDIDLSLVQGWDLHGDLGAQLAQHPAPDLSGRKA